jgi:dihydrofolate reductase
MLISLIAAVAANGVIGRDNALPWRLPDDLRRFKALTMGKPLIMGRKTYQSIGRALPGRANIVLTRRSFEAPGCVVAHSVRAALDAAGPAAEVMVIGGEDIYRQMLGLAGRMYLTRIEEAVEGDATFPELNPAEWMETFTERHPADDKNPIGYRFVILDRVASPESPGHRPAPSV